MKHLVIQHVDPKKLNPAGYNPRKISAEQFQKLRLAIREFGFVEPVLVQSRRGGRNLIIGGHQRVKAAIEDGLESVPIIRLDISDDKAKALNLALNKISGEWDMPLLKDLLRDLDASDFDLDLTGFSRQEVDDLLSKAKDGDMEEIDLRPPPKLVWFLIGIPIEKFGDVQKHVAALEAQSAVSVQSSRDK